MNKQTRNNIVSVVAAIVVLAAGFAISNKMRGAKAAPPSKPVVKKERTVDTMLVRNSSIPTKLEIQGTLAAYDKISIFSEVSGVLLDTERPFKVGSTFPKGAVIARIDQEEARLTLLSQKSTLLNAVTQLMPDLKIDYPESFRQWKIYLDQFDPEKPIKAFPAPVNDQEKYFIASRNLLTQYYNIKSAEERLGKYLIRAPFSGVVTVSEINPGGLVRAGQRLGELMSTSSYELESTVALSELNYIKVGNSVSLSSDDISGTWTGRVIRINDQIDRTTQSVKVFVKVEGKALREGMYLRGQVAAISLDNALRIPRELLVNQNTVYVYDNGILRLMPVQVVKITAETAIVRGLPNGTAMVKKVLPGLFDGMEVKLAAAT